MAHEISVNEIVGLQFKGKNARCRVVWRRKTSDGIRVRLLLISGQDCPWESELADLAAKVAPVRERIAREERRKYARHRLSIPLELREPHSSAPIRTSSAWISPNGCYVETILSVAVGGKLKVSLWIDSEKINCECTVKERHSNFGVVIQFTGLDENAREHLRERIETRTGRIFTFP